MVPMRDGVHLATDVLLPAGAGPWPVALIRSPYGRHNGGAISNRGSIDGLVERGVAVVLQDVRGRFASSSRQPESRLLRHAGIVWKVTFSPDGKLLATTDRRLRLWETAIGKPHGQPLGRALADPVVVAFSPNGKWLATGSYDGRAQLWEVVTRQPFGPPLHQQDAIWTLAFSPDGKLLAAGSRGGTLRLWETTTGQPHGQPMRHPGGVVTMAFIPDGRWLATGSADKTARLWLLAIPVAP